MQAISLLSFFRLLKSTLLNSDNMLSIPTTPMKLSLKDPWLFLSGQPFVVTLLHLLRLFFTPCLKLIFLWLGTLFLLFLSFLGFLLYFLTAYKVGVSWAVGLFLFLMYCGQKWAGTILWMRLPWTGSGREGKIWLDWDRKAGERWPLLSRKHCKQT